ncbi:hypothetical protein G9A89_011999 [Geosiphon pyriformis]|nr:hypothetical protein G9A89_011999 [Geosiphon pyriformis]
MPSILLCSRAPIKVSTTSRRGSSCNYLQTLNTIHGIFRQTTNYSSYSREPRRNEGWRDSKTSHNQTRYPNQITTNEKYQNSHINPNTFASREQNAPEYLSNAHGAKYQVSSVTQDKSQETSGLSRNKFFHDKIDSSQKNWKDNERNTWYEDKTAKQSFDHPSNYRNERNLNQYPQSTSLPSQSFSSKPINTTYPNTETSFRPSRQKNSESTFTYPLEKSNYSTKFTPFQSRSSSSRFQTEDKKVSFPRNQLENYASTASDKFGISNDQQFNGLRPSLKPSISSQNEKLYKKKFEESTNEKSKNVKKNINEQKSKSLIKNNNISKFISYEDYVVTIDQNRKGNQKEIQSNELGSLAYNSVRNTKNETFQKPFQSIKNIPNKNINPLSMKNREKNRNKRQKHDNSLDDNDDSKMKKEKQNQSSQSQSSSPSPSHVSPIPSTKSWENSESMKYYKENDHDYKADDLNPEIIPNDNKHEYTENQHWHTKETFRVVDYNGNPSRIPRSALTTQYIKNSGAVERAINGIRFLYDKATLSNKFKLHPLLVRRVLTNKTTPEEIVKVWARMRWIFQGPFLKKNLWKKYFGNLPQSAAENYDPYCPNDPDQVQNIHNKSSSDPKYRGNKKVSTWENELQNSKQMSKKSWRQSEKEGSLSEPIWQSQKGKSTTQSSKQLQKDPSSKEFQKLHSASGEEQRKDHYQDRLRKYRELMKNRGHLGDIKMSKKGILRRSVLKRDLDIKEEEQTTKPSITSKNLHGLKEPPRSYIADWRDRPALPEWLKNKFAVKENLQFQGWNPKKKVPREDMEKIRWLHREIPKDFTVPKLAETYQISEQAIKRILRSNFQPDAKYIERQKMKKAKKVTQALSRYKENRRKYLNTARLTNGNSN